MRRCAAGKLEPLAGLDAVERRLAAAELDDPHSIGVASARRGREAQLELGPSARVAASAAGRVADVFTTSRSPGARNCGRSWKRACASSSARSVTSSRTLSRPSPRASARLVRLRGRGGSSKRRRAHAERSRRVAGAVEAARLVALDQGEEAGHALLGRRPVGDVLAGERVLLHLRSHVAGVDRVDAEAGLLGAEHGGELRECGLRRAVAAPGLVRLDGRVGGEVDDPRAGGEMREARAGRAPAARGR